VGCKVGGMIESAATTYRFTLTMWDVKVVNGCGCGCGCGVLP